MMINLPGSSYHILAVLVFNSYTKIAQDCAALGGTWVQHAKKNWTQSDIRFCENEGSNRFKINEKCGHLDRKYS